VTRAEGRESSNSRLLDTAIEKESSILRARGYWGNEGLFGMQILPGERYWKLIWHEKKNEQYLLGQYWKCICGRKSERLGRRFFQGQDCA